MEPLAHQTRVGLQYPSSRSVRRRMAPWLFITPFLVSFLLFFAYPAVYSFDLSLQIYSGFGRSVFVGLHNYLITFRYPFFWDALENTLFYWAIHLVTIMPIAFLIALAINSRWVRWQKLIKPLVFMPQIVPIIAAGLIWKFLLSGGGPVSDLLGGQVNFIGDPGLARWAVVLFMEWLAVGWFTIIFLAGLTTISEEVVEAAKIDGATGWQTVRHVVIPLMKPIILFAFIIDGIGTLQMFTRPNILLSHGSNAPFYAMPILNLVVTDIQSGSFGLASAVGWVLFGLIMLLSLVQLKLFSERGA